MKTDTIRYLIRKMKNSIWGVGDGFDRSQNVQPHFMNTNKSIRRFGWTFLFLQNEQSVFWQNFRSIILLFDFTRQSILLINILCHSDNFSRLAFSLNACSVVDIVANLNRN